MEMEDCPSMIPGKGVRHRESLKSFIFRGQICENLCCCFERWTRHSCWQERSRWRKQSHWKITCFTDA